MPGLAIVIELGPVDAGAPEARVLADACSKAVSGGDCRIGEVANAAPRAVAIVSWDAGHRNVRIEIGIRRDGENRWSTREIGFREADPPIERWRSVGLVIAVLVGEAESSDRGAPGETAPGAAAGAPVKAPAPSAPIAIAGRPARGSRVLWLGVEALAGPAFDDGSWRFGGGAAGVVDIGPLVLAAATARYAWRPADDSSVNATWVGGSVGAGIHGRAAKSLRLEARLEVGIERVTVAVERPEADSGGRWIPALRGSGLVALGIAPRLALYAGGEAEAYAAGARITVQGQPAGRISAVGFGAFLGVRFGIKAF